MWIGNRKVNQCKSKGKWIVFEIRLIKSLTSFYFTVSPRFTRVPGRFLVIEEDAVASVTCEAFSYPPSVVTWTRPLVALPRGRSSVTNGTLTIQDFSVVDTGTSKGSLVFIITMNLQNFTPLNGRASTSLWGCHFLSEIAMVLVLSDGRCSLKHCSLVAKFMKESQSLHTN